MSETDGKRDARSLVSSILGKSAPTAPVLPDDSPLAGSTDNAAIAELSRGLAASAAVAAAEAGPAAAGPAGEGEAAAAPPRTQDEIDAEALELTEVYFALEEPMERDVLFDRITALSSPIVTDFLRAMMEEDEDEYVAAAAATELAKKGVPEAVERLANDLEDPEELYFFTNAIEGLTAARGAAFYDTLRAIWMSPERDAEQRREAMAAMELLDPARAMRDFEAFIASQQDMTALQDDQIEVAMQAFVRQEYRAAAKVLEALRQRIAAAPIDPAERDELRGFVQSGIDLLTGEV